jgi:hypothetical protein
MKAINLVFSTFQVLAVIIYVLFYNAQYLYSIYGTVQNLIQLVAK